MTLPVLIMVAFGLAMDAFAVSVAAGLIINRVRFPHVFRLGFAFGFFQFVMPVLGWFAGKSIAGYIGGWDHWLAFLLLTAIGVKMILEALFRHDRPRTDPTRGWTLLTLSVATSIDALAVGLSLALLGVSVWFPAVIIGLVAASLSAVGVLLGKHLARLTGHWIEALGGCVLIAIGLKILFDHLRP